MLMGPKLSRMVLEVLPKFRSTMEKRSEREKFPEQKSAGWNRSNRVSVIAIIIRSSVSLSTAWHRIVIFASRTFCLPFFLRPSHLLLLRLFAKWRGIKPFVWSRLAAFSPEWKMYYALEYDFFIDKVFHVLRVVRYLVWFLWNIITVSYPRKYIVRLQEFLIFAFDGWNKLEFEI